MIAPRTSASGNNGMLKIVIDRFLPKWQDLEGHDVYLIITGHDGKTIIPFCTSGSSSIEKSSSNISEKTGTGNWLSGNRFSGSATDDEIKNWLTGLELE